MMMDWNILNWIQGLHTAAGDVFMTFASRLGNAGLIWIAADVGLLLYPKTRKTGIAVGIALVLEVTLCNGLLKPLIARPRPCDIQTEAALLISRPTGYSFPSGHAASSFAASSALFFQKSRLRLPAVLLAGLIAFSRLYLFVHFPSDILAGILLGIITGAAGAFAGNQFTGTREVKKQ